MKTFLSLSIALFLCVAVTAQKNSALNGQIYTIKLTPSGGKSTGWDWTTDVISFKTGLIRAKAMREHEKFEDATCDIEIDSSSAGKTMTFKAEGKNPGGSKIKWDGKATGNKIEGTVVWTNAQGKRSYTFTGTRDIKK